MRTVFVICGALFIASAVFGQNYGAAERRARQAVSQTQQASQGGAAVTPREPAVPAQTPPPDPVLAATLQNIANLRADFGELKTNAAPKPSFTNDLAAAAQGTKASATTLAKFAGDLQAAIAGNEKLRARHQKLAQDVHALFNYSHLSAAQALAISNEVHQILQDGGVAAETVAAVDADIKTIADETK